MILYNIPYNHIAPYTFTFLYVKLVTAEHDKQFHDL